MEHIHNIERFFNDEIRDKKKAGRGAFAMRGKGVKHGISGALKTPYFYMSNKDRRKLNGEVRVFNMSDIVLTREEFDQKDEVTQRELLIRWRNLYSTKEIKEKLGLANAQFYSLLNKLDVPKGNGNAKKKSATKKKEKSVSISAENMDKPLKQEKYEERQVVEQRIITDGLHVEFNGYYDSEALTKLFTKLQLLVDGETNKYSIYLTMSEKPSKET